MSYSFSFSHTPKERFLCRGHPDCTFLTDILSIWRLYLAEQEMCDGSPALAEHPAPLERCPGLPHRLAKPRQRTETQDQIWSGAALWIARLSDGASFREFML